MSIGFREEGQYLCVFLNAWAINLKQNYFFHDCNCFSEKSALDKADNYDEIVA